MNKTTAFLLLLFAYLLSSCFPTQKGIVSFEQEPDEIFTKSSLKKFFADHPNPSIVLRVPKSRAHFSIAGNNVSTNADIYNVIEKELLKSDFNVKDRGLFEAVLDKNSASDYAKIRDLTDTDLILELVNINTDLEYQTNTYQSYKKRKVRKVVNGDITLVGALLEFKVIIVDSNEVAGTYEFNFSPCTEGCGFYINQFGTLYRSSGNIYTQAVSPYEFVESAALIDFVEAATQELIQNLR